MLCWLGGPFALAPAPSGSTKTKDAKPSHVPPPIFNNHVPQPTRYSRTHQQVTATDTTVKDLSTLNLEGAVETVLADDVVVGGTYNYNSAVRGIVGYVFVCWMMVG